MSHRKQLPARASIEQLKKQAKELLAELRAGSAEAAARLAEALPGARDRLADAQLVLAREYGFPSWSELRQHVDAIDPSDPMTAFVAAACVPLDADYASATADRADAILAAHPSLAGRDIFVAAIRGDDAAVARLCAADPGAATHTGGIYDWDPLTYLCFSRYLRRGGDGFLRAARVLLAHGASANTGFYAHDHAPAAVFESAIYGAAGVAHDVELTRLLLAHGADPNDDETPYHVPEGYDNAVLEVLVGSGRMSEQSLATMMLRKCDWHDYDGIVWLLAHGVDPNYLTVWGRRGLHQALERDNPLRFFEAMLDRGADPRLANRAGWSAIVVAARTGRADVLDLFARRGFADPLAGDDALLAACARGEAATARALAAADAGIVRRIEAEAPSTLADFAGAGNTAGVALLLDLGFDPARTTNRAGARDDTPLHAAIWRGRHATAKLLIARGAPLELHNGNGETPLAYAVRTMLHSEWIRERTTETIEALLAAGADRSVLATPTGWAPLDALLGV